MKGEEPALQPLGEENPEPPRKNTALLLMGSESEEETAEDNTVERYKVEPRASLHQCPLNGGRSALLSMVRWPTLHVNTWGLLPQLSHAREEI